MATMPLAIMYINPRFPYKVRCPFLHMQVISRHFLFMPYLYNFRYLRRAVHRFYNIAFPQVNGRYPALFLYINRMVCGCLNFLLPIQPDMVNRMRPGTEYLFHFLDSGFPGFFIPGINIVTFLHFPDRAVSTASKNRSITSKTFIAGTLSLK